MAEPKKYYWLKLKRDFFKRHDIQIIEAMPNGKDYILFYLKLLCESVDHEGNLRFSDQIPYNEQMLSTITNTNVDIVKTAIKIFTELKMMDVLDDGTYFMNEVQKMIGCETEWAQKKRDWRERKRLELLEDFSETKKDNVRQEIEIEKEIDIEIEKEIEKDKEVDIEVDTTSDVNHTSQPIDYSLIVSMFNDICKSYLPFDYQFLSVRQKLSIRQCMEKYTYEDFKTMFQKAEASDFLKGQNHRNWISTLGWMIRPENMAKILSGHYDNKEDK